MAYNQAMRTGAIPFQFDLRELLKKARRQMQNRVGDVTLNLPFVSVTVSPKDRERQIAREVVIRLRIAGYSPRGNAATTASTMPWHRFKRSDPHLLISRSNWRRTTMARCSFCWTS